MNKIYQGELVLVGWEKKTKTTIISFGNKLNVHDLGGKTMNKSVATWSLTSPTQFSPWVGGGQVIHHVGVRTWRAQFSRLSSQKFPQFFSQLPSLKLTWPLKMDGWKTSFLLGWSIFRGHVSFGEGTCHYQQAQKRDFLNRGPETQRSFIQTAQQDFVQRMDTPGTTRDPSLHPKNHQGSEHDKQRPMYCKTAKKYILQVWCSIKNMCFMLWE